MCLHLRSLTLPVSLLSTIQARTGGLVSVAGGLVSVAVGVSVAGGVPVPVGCQWPVGCRWPGGCRRRVGPGCRESVGGVWIVGGWWTWVGGRVGFCDHAAAVDRASNPVADLHYCLFAKPLHQLLITMFLFTHVFHVLESSYCFFHEFVCCLFRTFYSYFFIEFALSKS